MPLPIATSLAVLAAARARARSLRAAVKSRCFNWPAVWRNLLASIVFLHVSIIARGQSMNWGTLPNNTPGATINALESYVDGIGQALYVGGEFDGLCCSFQQYSHCIMRLRGSAWSSLWPGFNHEVYALAVCDHGQGPQLYAGGSFTNFKAVAQWDGAMWHEVGGGIYGATATVWEMTAYDDGNGEALYVAGDFQQAGAILVRYVAKWDGLNWSAVGAGLDSFVDHLCVYDSGSGAELYATGTFTHSGAVTVGGIAKWNGTSWSAVSSLYVGHLGAMCVHDDGTGAALYVNGDVPSVGAKYVSKWNGSQWSPVGQLRFCNIYSMASFDDGSGPALFVGGTQVYVGGVSTNQHIAKWQGGHWSTVGGGTDGDVLALHVYDDGSGARTRLMVGGGFLRAGAMTARDLAWWNGPIDPIDTLCFGDGTLAKCPCNIQGSSGAGCQNSAQTGGAVASASGSAVNDTLTINATGLLPHSLSIVFQGDVALTNGAKFGDGLLCVGGNRLRMFTTQSIGGAIIVPSPTDPSIRARGHAR